MKAVAWPGAACALFSVLWLSAAALGVPQNVDGRTMTLTEATAVASHADVARLLRAGADPNAPSRLRAGLILNSDMILTPLEAATGAVRTGPLQMLVDHGARIDAGNYAVLWCAAQARNNQDMVRFLGVHMPNVAPPDCATVRRIWSTLHD